MSDLRFDCEHCNKPITRTETLAARDISGDDCSCLDCAEQLTLEPIETDYELSQGICNSRWYEV